MSVNKIIALVLVVVVVVLIIYGVSNNLMGPVTNKVAGYYNYVLGFFNPAPVVPVSDVIFVNILGKQRNLTLNDGENRCVVNIEELGKFGLDFGKGSNGTMVWYSDTYSPEIEEKNRWENVISMDIFEKFLGSGNRLVGVFYGYNSQICDEKSCSFFAWNEFNNPGIRTILNSELKKLSINVDGKDYEVLLVVDGLRTSVGDNSYIYYPDKDNKINLKFYDYQTRVISDIPSEKLVESQKVQVAFEKLMSKKINYDGEDRVIFLKKLFSSTSSRYASVASDQIQIIFGFNYKYYAVGSGSQVLEVHGGEGDYATYHVLFRTFIVPKSQVEKDLDIIKTALNENCR